MKCADALPMLLDADLAALTADHASPLGEHVAGCVSCRAVVATLQADTFRLAALTVGCPEPAALVRRADRRRTIWLAPIPLAAAVVLAYLGFARAPTRSAPPAEPSVRVASTPAPSAFALTDRVGARSPRSNAPTTVPRRSSAVQPASGEAVESPRSTLTRIDVGGPILAKSVAPMPVAYDERSTDAELASVEVSTVGGRVVVLRPGNTNITVVWFY